MAKENQNIYRQVYNAYEDPALLALTDHIVCLFTRRGVLASAFNSADELLSIHYAGYSKDKPVWELDFFEQLFLQEPLLVKRDKITKVFFLSDKNIVVPDDLYEPRDAENWLRTICFTDIIDTIDHFNLENDRASYVYAIPLNIKELVKINCPGVPVLPLPAHQFNTPDRPSTSLQCFISAEQACVTFYYGDNLLWHKVFEYAAAEDIVYEINLLCKEHGIDAGKLTISCNTISATEYTVINNLSQYFTMIRTGYGNKINSFWSPTISLVQQLLTCR